MLDALLANLLSGTLDGAPTAAPAQRAAAVAPLDPAKSLSKAPREPKALAVGARAEAMRPAAAGHTTGPVGPARRTPAAEAQPQKKVVWQLYCQGDGKLYYHADKAYLERWVAAHNALYASARQALQNTPRTFYTPLPGYGFPAGTACLGSS